MSAKEDSKMKRQTGEVLSERAKKVMEWFGIKGKGGKVGVAQAEVETPELALAPGTITAITGASGSGKSSLLRRMQRKQKNRTWIHVDRIRLPDVMTVDCFEEEELEEVLAMLGRLGLGEVWTYLRRPTELSEGQRWRLRWAMALWQAQHHKNAVIVSDEFCSVLDLLTARVVCRCLRRSVDQLKKASVVVATARNDLEPALGADVKVRCDFGVVEVGSGDRATRSVAADGRGGW